MALSPGTRVRSVMRAEPMVWPWKVRAKETSPVEIYKSWSAGEWERSTVMGQKKKGKTYSNVGGIVECSNGCENKESTS